MGKPRRGLTTLPVVLSARDADEVIRYMHEESFRSRAAAGGAVISSWAAERRRRRKELGFNPHLQIDGPPPGSGGNGGLKSPDSRRAAGKPEPIDLDIWEEVQGEVLSVRGEDRNFVIELRTLSGKLVRIDVDIASHTDLPKTKRRPPIAGDLIAVLRTDATTKPHVLRFLGEPRGGGRRR
jgi:hypothetical protein